jgi:cobalt/nickel transport system ATP-binding protein
VLHLNGIHAVQHGSVAVSGLAVDDPNLLEVRRRVGLVFQDPDDSCSCRRWRDRLGPQNLGLGDDEVAPWESPWRGRVADLADRHPSISTTPA